MILVEVALLFSGLTLLVMELNDLIVTPIQVYMTTLKTPESLK